MKSFSKNSKSEGASLFVLLLPIMAAVLSGFLIIGIALPVLPLHVQTDLGYGTLIIGLVAGAQFAASLISRIWAGAYADRHGVKRAVMSGLIAAISAGLLYLLSLYFSAMPALSVTILILGRAVLGGAESFIITGGITWGLGLVNKNNSGTVIAWIGTAMFAAMALGGPLGSMLFEGYGFGAIAILTAILPAAVLIGIYHLNAPAVAQTSAKPELRGVLRSVWLPGLGAALASIGYCAILAFSSLYFNQQDWQPIWLAFSAFGVALIFARVIAGHLPDKFGGARIALIFALVQGGGLVIMWLSRNVFMATTGAAIAGFGYALVYPGLGVEAVAETPPENRGLTMGIYTAFLDVAMAIGSPLLGWIATQSTLTAVYFAGAAASIGVAGVALCLVRPRSPESSA